MAARFPRKVERVLTTSGWFPGRRVDTATWRAGIDLEMHPAAESFLSEFGRLQVDIYGPGKSVAREPFELDPLLCEGEEDRFVDWGANLGRSLYPLGELDQGRFFLGIDELGVIYLVVDWLASFGPADEGLTALILGIKPTELSTGS